MAGIYLSSSLEVVVAGAGAGATLLASSASASSSSSAPPQRPPPPSHSSQKTTTTDYIDCSQTCDGGDVNYELTASVQTMQLKFGREGKYGHNDGRDYVYRGRTFSSEEGGTTTTDGGQDSTTTTHMGPTMFVSPGQSLWIKLRNELYDGDTHDLSPLHDVNATDYWRMVQTPGEKIKYTYYKEPVSSPELMDVDVHNLPGQWDVTNLHLHGLDVEVHMFDPVNTHNPEADHVRVRPGQCYCYKFQLPAHHPVGMYWYHPHVHGSSAIQLWGGMMGLLYVVPPPPPETVTAATPATLPSAPTTPTTPTTAATSSSSSSATPQRQQSSIVHPELAMKYNIKNAVEFVLWDPAFQKVSPSTSASTSTTGQQKSHDIEVDEFLLGQTTLSKIHPFLVNGEITPNLATLQVGEVLHLRALCATIENENTFIIYRKEDHDPSQADWEWNVDDAEPFWVVGSDGVFYESAEEKKVIVMAGGQREELLLKFDQPGTYLISQQGIQGMQFFDMYGHPHDQLLATVEVVEGNDDQSVLPTNVEDMKDIRLTPGYGPDETIEAHQIAKTETIVFSMGANRNQAPFPQYYINGKAFGPDRLDFRAEPGQAVEYILINANHNVHPFHIHVNRFQVKEMGSELSTEKYPVLAEVMNFTENVWRDTVVVPPNGRTRIWVQYKNYTGKTVLHCHFLAHEDTGMMATLFIGPPDYVFHWEDHWQLILGLVVGALVGMSLLWTSISCLKAEGDRTVRDYYQYSVVAMNDLKKKTFD